MSSPYMTTAEVAEYLRYTVSCKHPLDSARKFILRHQLRRYPVGRDIRVLRGAVDAVLQEQALKRERLQPQRQRQAFHAGARVIKGGRR